jgi:hypothetical protein
VQEAFQQSALVSGMPLSRTYLSSPIMGSIPLPIASLTLSTLTTSAQRCKRAHAGLFRSRAAGSRDSWSRSGPSFDLWLAVRSNSSVGVAAPLLSALRVLPLIELDLDRSRASRRDRDLDLGDGGSGGSGMKVRYNTDMMS